MHLSDDLKKYFEGRFKTLRDNLLQFNSISDIKSYVNWMIEKARINNSFSKEMSLLDQINELDNNKDKEKIKQLKIEKSRFIERNRPYELHSGDIVNINFGIGIGHELQDDHYGIILSNKGTMFLIAPLTSSIKDFGDNTKCFKNLGLPRKKDDKDKDDISYINFTQIRFVHCRRITYIRSGENKVEKNIGKTDVDDIMMKFFCVVVDLMS